MTDTTHQDRTADALERIGKVLGALYASTLHELDLPDKANRLSRCGFANAEIADVLGSTPGSIGVALHKSRKTNGKSRTKKTRKAK